MLATDNKTGSYSTSKMGFWGGVAVESPPKNYNLGPATTVTLWKSSETKERKLSAGGEGEAGRDCYKQKVHWKKLGLLKVPWTEGPGGLQSMGSLRVGHD